MGWPADSQFSSITTMKTLTASTLIVMLAGAMGLATAEESSFYEETPLFSPTAEEANP